MQSFRETKDQIIHRPSQGRQLADQYSLDLEKFIERSYHKFFSIKQRAGYYTSKRDRARIPFTETLRLLENSESFEVINIQQFEHFYQISYVDLDRLKSGIEKIQQLVEA